MQIANAETVVGVECDLVNLLRKSRGGAFTGEEREREKGYEAQAGSDQGRYHAFSLAPAQKRRGAASGVEVAS